MQQSQNRYEYLYHTLVLQLESGAFPYGRPLPSQQELCGQYGVGITTVRRALKLLEENGYLRTARGLPATVTYRASPEAYLAALAGRREEVEDAFQAMGLMMPPLYLEGAKRCGPEEIRRLREILSQVPDRAGLPLLYRQANAFFTTLLKPLGNRLALELELDAENYLHIPYLPLPHTENPFALTPGRLKTWLETAIFRIERGQYGPFLESVHLCYQETSGRVGRYLRELEAHTAKAPKPAEEIRWFHGKEHSELFARLAMTILRRITAQEFSGRKYLPSIPALMREYGVTKDTASRAVALLNALGVTQTLDKKGTVLAAGEEPALRERIDWSGPEVRTRLSAFLDALQIVVLTIRGCAAAFRPVPDGLARELESLPGAVRPERVSPLLVQLLMNYAIHASSSHALQNIYRQLNSLIAWGYYLQAADRSLYPSCAPIARELERLSAALRNGGQGLPEMLERIFSLIYRNVTDLVAKLPELSGLADR